MMVIIDLQKIMYIDNSSSVLWFKHSLRTKYYLHHFLSLIYSLTCVKGLDFHSVL